MAAISNSDLKEGHIFSINDVSFKRFNEKTDLSQVDILNLFGKSLMKNISKNEIFKSIHFNKNIK